PAHCWRRWTERRRPWGERELSMSVRCSKRTSRRPLPSPSGSPVSHSRAVMPWAAGAATPPYAVPWLAALMKKIADAGLLIGFLDRLDSHHKWAAGIFEAESPPFYTAEPVLAEVAAVLGTADDVLRMVETGDLVIALDLAEDISAVRSLVVK